jgi:hypothetical protein
MLESRLPWFEDERQWAPFARILPTGSEIYVTFLPVVVLDILKASTTSTLPWVDRHSYLLPFWTHPSPQQQAAVAQSWWWL